MSTETEHETTPPRTAATLGLTATVVAFVAALAVQLFHEISHGLTALAVGGDWQRFSLFAVDTSVPEPNADLRDAFVAGTAAILNIITGFVIIAVLTRAHRRASGNPLTRLFLTYLAGYSLLTGFGYLFIDALFRAESGLGDWARVLDWLDAGGLAQVIVGLVGIAGIVFAFIWLPTAMLRFVPDGAERVRISILLHQVPYVVVNVIFTVLAIWHPVGADGTVAVVLQYWLGSFALFWGGFMAAWWLTPNRTSAGMVALPNRISIGWTVASVVGLIAAVAIVSPIGTA